MEVDAQVKNILLEYGSKKYISLSSAVTNRSVRYFCCRYKCTKIEFEFLKLSREKSGIKKNLGLDKFLCVSIMSE